MNQYKFISNTLVFIVLLTIVSCMPDKPKQPNQVARREPCMLQDNFIISSPKFGNELNIKQLD
jgi:hypothetical protein